MMYRRIPLEHTCVDLVPGRLLRVVELVLEEVSGATGEEGIVRVEYTITPPLPRRGRGSTVAAWPVVWTWQAMDDVGTTYEEAGGAYGPVPDGSSTTGTLSLRPLPPPQARHLRILLLPWFPWADAEETFRECAVEIDLSCAQ